MKGIIKVAVRIVRAGQLISTRKWSFLWLFVVLFFGNVYMLAKLDLLPEIKETTVASAVVRVAEADVATQAVVELPTKIEIPNINLSANITNPTTTVVEALDAALLKGPVRYPTSAKLGEAGNVVIFGHSSYLPVVGNQSYKSFNGIQKLVAGDVITVSSEGTAYTYRVRNVMKEVADANAGIPLAISDKVLTLVTCNSFGTKSDRFIVTADFVESHSVSI